MKQLQWLGSRCRSFVYAGEGIIRFFKEEPNAAIHLLATVAVACLSLYYRISKGESIAILFSVGLVWISEMLNTAIEKTMDFITLEKHPQIKVIKDLSAGAVLVAALVAAITGCIIFLPKIF